MAERHRRRDAGLAGMDLAPELGGEPVELQPLDLEAALALDHFLGDIHQPEALGYLAGAGLVAARRTVDQQDARLRRGRLLPPLGLPDGIARGDPLERQLVLGIGVARTGRFGARRLAAFVIAVPGCIDDL